VRVVYAGKPTIHAAPNRKTIELPLVKGGQPNMPDLTSDRIAEVLVEEDVEALKEQWNASS
jgi:hypothetical protein